MRERARGRRKRRGAESQRGVGNLPRKQYRGGICVQLVSVAVVVVVSVAPSVVVSVVVSSSCPPLCPSGNFDGKSMRLSLHCYPAPVRESSEARCHAKNTQPCYQKRSNAIAGHFQLMLNGSGAARSMSRSRSRSRRGAGCRISC